MGDIIYTRDIHDSYDRFCDYRARIEVQIHLTMTFQQPANLTGLSEIFQYANETSEHIFGPGILLTLYVIIVMYLNSKGQEIEDCCIVAGFITSISGIFMMLAGLITQLQLFICVLGLVLPVLWKYWNVD